jgi:hypothetical protein
MIVADEDDIDGRKIFESIQEVDAAAVRKTNGETRFRDP